MKQRGAGNHGERRVERRVEVSRGVVRVERTKCSKRERTTRRERPQHDGYRRDTSSLSFDLRERRQRAHGFELRACADSEPEEDVVGERVHCPFAFGKDDLDEQQVHAKSHGLNSTKKYHG